MRLTGRASLRFRVESRTLVIILTVLATLSACRSQEDTGWIPTTGVASAMLGIRSCEVVRQTVDRTPGQRLSVSIPIDGEEYRIDLKPHSVRATGYRVLVQDANGAVTIRRADPVRTLRGTVRGRPGCSVAGSLQKDGLYLMVRLEDGRRCWMEPLPEPTVAPHTYAVYQDQRCDRQKWTTLQVTEHKHLQNIKV